MPQKIIKIKSGNLFPIWVVYACYVIFLVGLVLAVQVLLAPGLTLMIVSLLPITSYVGLVVHRDQGYFRTFTSMYGIRSGKKKPLADYPDAAVLRKRIKYRMAVGPPMSSMDANGVQQTMVFYSVCMLSANHRQKVELKRYDDPESAQRGAEELAELLSLNLTNYAPKISAQSKRRKRRR
jgi:hypothetical protein